MNKWLKILFFCLISYDTIATAQAPDVLIWKEDTLVLYSNPLESHPKINSFRAILFGVSKGGITTGCWRGYIAYWEIIDSQLYLTNIISCLYFMDSLKADLKKLFPIKYKDGKVKADWVQNNLSVQKGKMLYYIHDAYQSIYEKEVEIGMKDGQITFINEYDNSLSYQSEFTKSNRLLIDYIQSHINWSIIPYLRDEKVKVFLKIISGAERRPDSVFIVKKSNNEIIDAEAITVIKNLPEWDVLYRKGKLIKIGYHIPIIFSEENRKKYSK